MRSFTIGPLGLLVLFGLLAVISLILIMPEVDLLDTAFQRNTSPLAIYARSTSTPLTGTEVSQLRLAVVTSFPTRYQFAREAVQETVSELAEILNQSFRC